MRGSWRPNITAIFWPHSYGRQRCVFLILKMLNRRPRGPLCWVMAFFTASYQHLLWFTTDQGPKPLRPGVSFPSTSRPTPTPTLTGTLSWLSYIIVQHPLDRQLDLLEWHDWWSSSGNNCHAVHMSLSPGSSVYECIMGFTLSHFISQIHPRDLFRLLAIGMCHFLPVYHFVMACLLGAKVKI